MSVKEKGSVYEQPSVYNQGGGGGGSGVPEAYELLENKAIRWNSTSYNAFGFDTAPCDNGGKIYTKIYQPNTDGSAGALDYLFVLSDGYKEKGAFLYIQGHAPNKDTNATNKNRYSYSTVTTDTFRKGIFEYEFTQNGFRINDNHYIVNYNYFANLTKAWIIPCNQNNIAAATKAAFVECKITDINNKVCFDAVCVKRKYDNSIGVYDKVTGIFTTSPYFLVVDINP